MSYLKNKAFQAVELQRIGQTPDYLIVLDGPDRELLKNDHF